ncbi:MAG: hypothetical protein RTU30_16045 [Candidatus Thorarchaeota archaeon]
MAEKRKRLHVRDTYSIKTLLTDIKKLRLTPSLLYTVGSEIIYFEWKQAKQEFGDDDPITIHLEELLNYMQTEYEEQLIEGELRREKDTPSYALNSFLKETPIEFQSYVLERSGDYIGGVLRAAQANNDREFARLTKVEEGLRVELKKSPNDPELWNQLRLVLWILGKYDEASDAYKKAKKLGWEKSKSKTVAI